MIRWAVLCSPARFLLSSLSFAPPHAPVLFHLRVPVHRAGHQRCGWQRSRVRFFVSSCFGALGQTWSTFLYPFTHFGSISVIFKPFSTLLQ